MAGYGTDDTFNAWLTDNGYSLPAGAPAVAVLRQRGSQYVDATYGGRFVGHVADLSQERQWPREGAIAGGRALPSDLVPAAVVNASYFAGYQEAVKPGSLSVVASTSGAVKRVKVGPIEKEYQGASSDGSAASFTPLISTVDGMLAPFLKDLNAVPFGILSIGGC